MSGGFVRCLVTVCIASGVAHGSAVQAQTVTTTVVGRIGGYDGPFASPSNGDALGLFGRKGRDLAGSLMSVTYTFDVSAMVLGGALADSYSAWQGDTGSVVVRVGTRSATPPVDEAGNARTTKVDLYSNDQGEWAAYQFTQFRPGGGYTAVGVSVISPKHPFDHAGAVAQALSYSPPASERRGQQLVLDITSGGVREYLTAAVLSITHGP